MTQITRRIVGLCIPAWLMCAVDSTLTLAGQTAEYWDGNYQAVNEISPLLNRCLQIGPAAFIAGMLAWAGVFTGLIVLAPDTLALIVAISVTFAHMIGSATWLLYRYQLGYLWCSTLIPIVAAILAVGIRWGWGARPEGTYPLTGWSPWLRWGLILILSGCGIAISAWPPAN